MKALLCAACLILPMALTGCDTTETYPLTGEDCGPNDPVQTLDASDCSIPGVV